MAIPQASASSAQEALRSIVPPTLPLGIDTPALVIDLDVVERNAARVAGEVAAAGIALRPHVKTHKSLGLARIQLEAGARGLTVGNIGEAEVFAAAGFDDLLIAYPVWVDGPKAARLRALHELDGLRLTVGFDSVAGAQHLAAAVAGLRPLPVMVELDPGNARTGALPAEAGTIAAAARQLGLDVRGIFTHGGHGYASPAAAVSAGRDEVRVLTIGRDALRAEGIEPEVVSAGSTPTQHSAAAAPVTELRPGTYLLGDRQQWALGAVPSDGLALVVAATVVSEAVAGQVVVDAGAKTLTKDVAPYLEGHGAIPAYPDAVIQRVSDYHGVVRIPAGSPRPALGEVLAIVPNHVCPVVDLRDSLIATRAGTLVGTWPVDARGRSG
jgi:D-serine deaminase-like pyridoxal phosphate-dependent protein